MSLFVASTCQILGDIIVNHVAWSKVEQIAALSAYTVDDNDRETNQVLFTNNEVRSFCLVAWSILTMGNFVPSRISENASYSIDFIFLHN
jgi:hypothetical protein